MLQGQGLQDFKWSCSENHVLADFCNITPSDTEISPLAVRAPVEQRLLFIM